MGRAAKVADAVVDGSEAAKVVDKPADAPAQTGRKRLPGSAGIAKKQQELKDLLVMMAKMRGAENYDIADSLTRVVKQHGREAVIKGMQEYDVANNGRFLGDLIPALEEPTMTNVATGPQGAVTSVDDATPAAAATEGTPPVADKPRAKRVRRKAAAEETSATETQAANAGQPTPAQAAAATQAVQGGDAFGPGNLDAVPADALAEVFGGIIPGNSAANIRSMAGYVPPYQRVPQPAGYAPTQVSTYDPSAAASPAPQPQPQPQPQVAQPQSDMIARLTAWQQSGGQASAGAQMTNKMNAWVKSQAAKAAPAPAPSSSQNIRNMLNRAGAATFGRLGKSLDTTLKYAIPGAVYGGGGLLAAQVLPPLMPIIGSGARAVMDGFSQGFSGPDQPAMSDEERLQKLESILNAGIGGTPQQ